MIKIEYISKYNDAVECTLFGEIGQQIYSKGYSVTVPSDYNGVTTVLSNTSDKSFLVEWRKRIGDQEADKIVNESILIGKQLDTMLYSHFTGGVLQSNSDVHEKVPHLYKQLLPKLKYIEPVACQLKVTSDKHRLYGYVDMLCYYKGVLTLLDFKNARRLKDQKELTDYKLQCTMYCMFLYEQYGIAVKQIMLLIAVRDSVYPQVVIEETKHYVKEAISRICVYRSSGTSTNESPQQPVHVN